MVSQELSIRGDIKVRLSEIRGSSGQICLPQEIRGALPPYIKNHDVRTHVQKARQRDHSSFAS